MSTPAPNTHQLARKAWFIFGGGLAAHALTFVIANGPLSSYQAINLPLHAAVEAQGALLALMTAYVLLRLHSFGQGSRFNQRISAALIAMGVLDGLHSLTSPGQVFVWLHSSAILLGGALFFSVWLPKNKLAQSLPSWPRWALLMTVAMSAVSFFLPERLPHVIEQGSFTHLFVIMNMAGGALMLLAAIRLAISYQRYHIDEDLLFCLQCVLFGFGALIYQQSELWNLTWWSSHLFRLLAYAVSLWLLARVVTQAEERRQHQLNALELEAANLRLLTLSVTDGLTGIANRRCFDETLQAEWHRATRANSPIALAFIDVDYFKKYNDCYGHQAGDQCLQTVAHLMKHNIRRVGDLVARYGGEEFVVIAPQAEAQQLFSVVELIRAQLEQQAIEHHQSPFGVVTLSVGVSSCNACVSDSPERLIKQADTALYHAKSAGRNRVVIYRADEHEVHTHRH